MAMLLNPDQSGTVITVDMQMKPVFELSISLTTGWYHLSRNSEMESDLDLDETSIENSR